MLYTIFNNLYLVIKKCIMHMPTDPEVYTAFDFSKFNLFF